MRYKFSIRSSPLQEYTLELSFTEFEDLFQFHSRLLAPWNLSSRFHHLVERLHIVFSDVDSTKRMVIGLEPSSYHDAPTIKAPERTGLLASEESRRRFLDSLNARQELEAIKATMRIGKISGQSTVFPGRSCAIHQTNMTRLEPPEAQSDRLKRVSHVTRVMSSERIRVSTDVTESRTDIPLIITSYKLFDSQMRAGSVTFSNQLIDASRDIMRRIDRGNPRHLDSPSTNPTSQSVFLDHLRLIARERGACREACKVSARELERLRDKSIARKRREKDISYARMLVQARMDSLLVTKKRIFRLNAKKHEMVSQHVRALVVERNRRLDKMKQEIVRQRSIALRVSTREQLVRETKWMDELGVDAVEPFNLSVTDPSPSPICSKSAIVSAKTFKTETSSSQVMTLTSQEELLKKKAEFLQKAERNDRLRPKLEIRRVSSSARSTMELEIEKIAKWRAERNQTHEKLLRAKLAKQDRRHYGAALAQTRHVLALNTQNALQKLREAHWSHQERVSNKSVIHTALERGCRADALIPCLII